MARLLISAHTEPYEGGEVDWPSWRTFVASLGDPQLTTAGLCPDLWAIGHSTTKTAAAIQQDGLVLADALDSPSLSTLRDWLTAWENAGRPAPEASPVIFFAVLQEGRWPPGPAWLCPPVEGMTWGVVSPGPGGAVGDADQRSGHRPVRRNAGQLLGGRSA
ncbi:hypothetical protein OG528_35890 [Streptomyces platensis]|uniref:hypothetical protein n=1 Tax=Streptomyces platensis TaxID=58346 RepID=UPI0030E5D340